MEVGGRGEVSSSPKNLGRNELISTMYAVSVPT